MQDQSPYPNWDLYKIANENWRFQIQQFWSRNSYFAAFQTASIAGVVKLSESHVIVARWFCGAGIALALLWWLSNDRLQQYNRFWWEKLIELEKRYIPDANGPRLAADFARWRASRPHRLPRVPWRYSSLPQLVPVVFIAAWAVLFVAAINHH